MRTPVFLALLALGSLPSTGWAQVYSWKDASGKIHYGDRPPTEQAGQSRKMPSAPMATPDNDTARKTAAERHFAEREKQAKLLEESRKPAETPAQQRDRAANCRQARINLSVLESGQMRFTFNAKGERVALEGNLRETELAKARQAVDGWCKPPAATK